LQIIDTEAWCEAFSQMCGICVSVIVTARLLDLCPDKPFTITGTGDYDQSLNNIWQQAVMNDSLLR